MRDNLPLVSIVTPSYNQGRFIEETLLSVKNQDYPNIEHIIVDGCSTDNALEIIKKYEGTYNMRWISEPDEGHGDAINKGFKMAKGEIFAWLSSDDVYFDRQVLSYVVAQFKKFPEVDVIYGDDVLIDKDSNIFRIRRVFDWNYNRLLRGISISQPATFFREEVVRQNKLDESLYFTPDFEFWLRLGKKGYNFKYVNRILAGDRIHRARISLSDSRASVQEGKEDARKHGQRFGLKYYLFHYLVDIPELIVIKRILEIPHILRIERELDNLAFDAKCKSKPSRVFSQMAPGFWLLKFNVIT